MGNVLILNMTRMGDLIQTTPIIREIKSRNRSNHVTLVVSESFREICSFIPGVDDLISFPLGMIAKMLERGEIVSGYRELLRVIERINVREYELIINLTHSRVSALLVTLLKTNRVVGYEADGEGYSHFEGDWGRYFFNIVPNRNLNPFHICDLHLFMAGLGPCGERLFLEVPNKYRERALEILSRHGASPSGRIVGITPGASNEHKMWGAVNFSKLAEYLVRRESVQVLLFGSSKEREMCEEIAGRAGEGVCNLAGRTTLGELASLIEMCELMITNDTGPLHISTAVGTKVVEISLGAAYFRETGPYGQGHYVVEAKIPCHPCGFSVKCPHMSCREYVSYDAIESIVSSLLKGEEPESLPDESPFESVQVYVSVFDERDGMIDYKPLIKRGVSEREVLMYIYRNLFSSHLGKRGEGFVSLSPQEVRDRISRYFSISSLGETILGLEEKAEKLKELVGKAKEALEVVSRMKKDLSSGQASIETLEESVSFLKGIDEAILSGGEIFPQIRPLTRMFRHEMEAIVGAGPLDVATETGRVYERFIVRAQTFLEHLSIFKNYVDSFSLFGEIPIKKEKEGSFINCGTPENIGGK